MTPTVETVENFPDTETLRKHLIGMARENIASRSKIEKTRLRAHRRVLAQRRDMRWLAEEEASVARRCAEIQRLLPEFQRRDQLAAAAESAVADGTRQPALGVVDDTPLAIG